MSYLLVVATTVVIYAVLSVGLNIAVGYAGQPHLAQGAFLGIGAYMVAVFSTRYELSFWVSMLIAIAVTVRPLLPSGALRARRGLPSVILMRGVIAGALFGAEIYVPYLLIDEYGFSATWAGLGLTAAALAWAAAAEVQGRVGDRLGNRRITLIGVAFLASSMAIVGLVAVTHAHPVILIAGWGLSGAGMGLMYPRLTVLTLAYSTTQNQGFNSAALSISDAVGAATTIAAMGLVYTGLGGGILAFAWVFALGTLVALAALVPGLRLGHGAEVRASTVPV